MASIRKEIPIDASAASVWEAIREPGAVHERLAPGFVVDCRLDDDDTRVVTFANGVVARELLVDIDDDTRRAAYSVVEGPLPTRHHHASMQVFPDGVGHCQLVWVCDVTPDAVAAPIAEMMEQGAAVMKQTLERETIAS